LRTQHWNVELQKTYLLSPVTPYSPVGGEGGPFFIFHFLF